jgi:ArsR family transcriptional regulator
VLHYLTDQRPPWPKRRASSLAGGKLLVVDFAPHTLEFLREGLQHRRLGFSDEEMEALAAGGGAEVHPAVTLPPPAGRAEPGLTVKIRRPQER